MRSHARTATCLVIAVLAGCASPGQPDATQEPTQTAGTTGGVTFTVWNYSDQDQAGAIRVLDDQGAELTAFPFEVGPGGDPPSQAQPEHGILDLAPGAYTFWAGASGNRTVEESHTLESGTAQVRLEIHPDRLTFRVDAA